MKSAKINVTAIELTTENIFEVFKLLQHRSEHSPEISEKGIYIVDEYGSAFELILFGKYIVFWNKIYIGSVNETELEFF